MLLFRTIAVIFFLYPTTLSANKYIPNDSLINSLISQKSCSLNYNNIKQSDEDIIDILKTSDINSSDWQIEFSSIKPRLDRGNLSCYLKINITAIYAQRLYEKGDLVNAENLFSKTLTYTAGDKEFKKSIRSKLKSIQSKTNSPSTPLDSDINNSSLALNSTKLDSTPAIRYGKANQDVNYEEENITLQGTIKSLEMQLNASIDSELNYSFEIEDLKNELLAANLKITYLDSDVNSKIKNFNELNLKMAQILSNSNIPNETSNNNKLSFSYLNLFLFTSVIVLITATFTNINSVSAKSDSEQEPDELESEESESEEPESEELKPEETEPPGLKITKPNTKKDLHDNEKLLKCIQSIIGKTKISLADGYYFYSYSQGVSENMILDGDNELEPSYLLDRLINTFFNESPIFIKSQYRFMESDEMINANHDGAYDAAFFYKHGEIKKLPIIIKSNHWKHIFDNQISGSQEAVKIKKTPEKDSKITGIGKLPRT